MIDFQIDIFPTKRAQTSNKTICVLTHNHRKLNEFLKHTHEIVLDSNSIKFSNACKRFFFGPSFLCYFSCSSLTAVEKELLFPFLVPYGQR